MSTVETSVKVIPLGGLEQIGMNMTVFEYGESIIVVDCGMSFPGDEMLGIDMVHSRYHVSKTKHSQGKGRIYYAWSRGSYRCIAVFL